MKLLNKFLITLLTIALCGMPQFAQAQQSPATPNSSPQTSAPPAQTKSGQSGVTVDPSQGPLQPVPAETQQEPAPVQPAPASSQAEQNSGAQAQTAPENPQPQKPAEPVGAATAEKGRTQGGAASKPAGTAIAPAKQRQVRSWLIKIGAIAAAGAAAGTIYALSRKTPSLPPGAAAVRAASH